MASSSIELSFGGAGVFIVAVLAGVFFVTDLAGVLLLADRTTLIGDDDEFFGVSNFAILRIGVLAKSCLPELGVFASTSFENFGDS